MKKRYKQYAGPQLAACGLLLALLLSGLPHIDAYAEDLATDSPFIELKDDKIKRNPPTESDTIHNAIHMVGPSGQDIHDFLYPMPKVDEAVTPDN
jgi:hypothetical protein